MTGTGGDRGRSLRRQIERLETLPIRPETARAALLVDRPVLGDLDPGWTLGRALGLDTLELLATRSWWPTTSEPASQALDRLWRHGVATSLAARKLAEEVGDPDPKRLAAIGLTHALGHWAAAAVDPEALAATLTVTDPSARRAQERRSFGAELSQLGRALATRWRADPLLADACWLIDLPASDLDFRASDPARLRLLRRARAWADRTPWALGGEPIPAPGDPARLWLLAELQNRCRSPFVASDTTLHEQALIGRCARLQRDNDTLRQERAALEQCLDACAGISPGLDGEPVEPKELPEPTGLAGEIARRWHEQDTERARLAGDVEALASAVREGVDRQAIEAQRARQEGLGEFAGGAGHELNNPLAVILGRAQLLLARHPDPEIVPSLRIVIAQARRAHRILRDLMYVARPPELRVRPCAPDQILRSCVADLQAEAETRGVRLTCRSLPTAPLVRGDIDGLRHLIEVLLRNALEATPQGGEVRVGVAEGAGRLDWTITDNGKGLGEAEGRRLFDPFYCGRQAGRGLGLGLPRAARFVAQCGGTIRWTSHPGQGTTFHVSLPAEVVAPFEGAITATGPA